MGLSNKTFVAASSLPTGRLWLSLGAAWLLGLVSALGLPPLTAAALSTAGLVLVATLCFGVIRNAFASEQRKITLLLNAGPEGILEIDASGRIVFVNPQLCALFGYQQQELLGLSVEKLVPSAARDTHAAHRMAFWNSDRSRLMGSDLDIHGVRKDGVLIPVDVSLTRLQTGRGTVMYCMIRDNRTRKAFESQLLESNRRLTDSVAALERQSGELQTLTEMGDLLHSSNTGQELYEIVARTMGRLFPGVSGAMYVLDGTGDCADRVAGWGPYSGQLKLFAGPADCWALRRGRPHQYLSVADHPRCEHGTDGIFRPGCCVPLLGHGELLGMLHLSVGEATEQSACCRSVLQLLNAAANQVALSSANLRLRNKLIAQSHIDPLTGLANRRLLENVFEQNVRQALLEQGELALLVLDVDHFKLFNDRHGHDGGDVVLREVAELLRQLLRHEDLICRIGGEEFAVLLPKTSGAEAEVVAEKLRASVEGLNVQREGRALGRVTVSIGVAALDGSRDSPAALMRRADRALYRAKAGGRNRVASGRRGDETGQSRVLAHISKQA